MTKKKIILAFVLSISLLGIFGCILDCPDTLPFMKIENAHGYLYSNEYEEINSTTDLDSLVVYIEFEIGYTACNFVSPFISRSYAWSCDPSGTSGLKDKITNIRFISSVDYLGIPAGNDLDIRLENSRSKEELIDELNDYLINFVVFIDKKQVGVFDLSMMIDFESGQQFQYDLANFEWE